MTPSVKAARDSRGRHLLWSDDPKTPKDRFVVEEELLEEDRASCGPSAWIEVREETATARYATRSEAEVHDRIVMSRAQAEWVCRELASVLGLKVMGAVK